MRNSPVARLRPKPAENGAGQTTRHLREQRRIKRDTVAQSERQRQHALPDRNIGNDMVRQVNRRGCIFAVFKIVLGKVASSRRKADQILMTMAPKRTMLGKTTRVIF